MCTKVSVTDSLDGSYQVSLQQQIQFYSKIFGNRHCRYDEGPLNFSQNNQIKIFAYNCRQKAVLLHIVPLQTNQVCGKYNF